MGAAEKRACVEIHRVLKPGGILVLMEGTMEGLQRLNDWRVRFGLEAIPADGRDRLFTRKFSEQELLDFCRPYYHLERVQRFGMYYFLTRIVQPLLVAPGSPVTTTKSTRSPAPSPGSIRILRAWATSWRSCSRSGDNTGSLSMICLTFDTDYAGSDDLRRLLAEHPIPGKATFFLHAPAAGIEWGDHEVEPHPVFTDREPWEETIAAWEARLSGPYLGLRPHSCATSHILGCIMSGAVTFTVRLPPPCTRPACVPIGNRGASTSCRSISWTTWTTAWRRTGPMRTIAPATSG